MHENCGAWNVDSLEDGVLRHEAMETVVAAQVTADDVALGVDAEHIGQHRARKVDGHHLACRRTASENTPTNAETAKAPFSVVTMSLLLLQDMRRRGRVLVRALSGRNGQKVNDLEVT